VTRVQTLYKGFNQKASVDHIEYGGGAVGWGGGAGGPLKPGLVGGGGCT